MCYIAMMHSLSVTILTPPQAEELTNLPSFVEKMRQPQMPLGAGVVLSYLKKELGNRVNVAIADYYSKIGSTIDDLMQDLHKRRLETKSLVIGISSTTQLFSQSLIIANTIKKDPAFAGTKVVLGGPVTNHYLPEIMSHKVFDGIAIGNGNLSFHHFIEYVLGERDTSPTEGFFTLIGDKYEGSSASSSFLIKSIKAEVPIDYSLFQDRYGFSYEEKTANVFTGYGCPYNCRFCDEAKTADKYKQQGWRRFEIIKEELAQLKLLGFRRISVLDDSLLNNPIANQLIELLGKNKFVFEIRSRINQINLPLLKHLQKNGLRRLFLGVEHSDDLLLKKLGKTINREQIIEKFRLIRRFPDIDTVAYIMLGVKDESIVASIKAVLFPIRLRASMAHYGQLMLYPGTDMYKDYIKETATDPWREIMADPSNNVNPPSYSFSINPRGIVAAAYILFYLQPRRLPGTLNMFLGRYFSRGS